MNCYGCEHYMANNGKSNIRVKGKNIKPYESYCIKDTPHKITFRDAKDGSTPLWCPFAHHKDCLYCGRLVREDEDICDICRKEGKK